VTSGNKKNRHVVFKSAAWERICCVLSRTSQLRLRLKVATGLGSLRAASDLIFGGCIGKMTWSLWPLVSK